MSPIVTAAEQRLSQPFSVRPSVGVDRSPPHWVTGTLAGATFVRFVRRSPRATLCRSRAGWLLPAERDDDDNDATDGSGHGQKVSWSSVGVKRMMVDGERTDRLFHLTKDD